jgi:hypothetical protein
MAAVMAELPFVLAISWVAAQWLTRHFAISTALSATLIMGGVAFAVLMAAEVALAVIVFGQPFSQYLASFHGVDALVGLAGQVAFADLSTLQLLTIRRRPG